MAALLFGDRIESFFNNLKFVSIMLFVTGVWLFLGEACSRLREKKSAPKESPGIGGAILIGLAQSLALFPGISRSGATISSGVMFGLKREEAFRFSFLLSIPAVAGALVYKLKDFTCSVVWSELKLYLLGGLVAFIAGILTLRLLFTIVRQRKLYYFGIYCTLAGIVTFIIARGQ